VYAPYVLAAHMPPSIAFAPSVHTHEVPLRWYEPALHGAPGFVVQAPDSAQATHAPEPSQKPPLQPVPTAALDDESTHACVPVTHDTTPSLQALGLVEQLAPAVHATHAPELLQTSFVPHVVPAPRFVAASRQRSTPVEQSVTPFLHGVGFVVQLAPAVHALQAPSESQTSFVPQLVPALFVASSTHVAAPEPQLSLPVLQGVGFVVHADPSTHAMHPPLPSHTLPVPQVVPAPRGVPSPQVGAPLEQSVTPFLQAVGFVVHDAPVVQSMHAPVGLHTLFRPHATPGPRLPVESLHVGPPDPHASTPSRHAVGLVAHAVPAVQVTHAPIAQIFPLPHRVPSGVGALSTHGAPPSHDVTPVLQGAPAFVVQTSPAEQLAGWQVPLIHASVPLHGGVQPLPPSVVTQTPFTQAALPVHAGEQPPAPPSGATQRPCTHWFVPVQAGVHTLEPRSVKPPSFVTHAPSMQTSVPVHAGEQSLETPEQSERHVPSSQQVSPSRQVPSSSHLKPVGALELISWQLTRAASAPQSTASRRPFIGRSRRCKCRPHRWCRCRA
jgi:hypothetical protein